jgi:hypothetical protein
MPVLVRSNLVSLVLYGIVQRKLGVGGGGPKQRQLLGIALVLGRWTFFTDLFQV